MRTNRVLIVDDEKNVRLTLSQALEALALETDAAMNGEEALVKLEKTDFGLMLLDLKMPGMDGLKVLRRVRDLRPDIKVIIITAHGTIDTAVTAMKQGAYDFLQKPFPVEVLLHSIGKALESRDLKSLLTLYESSRAVFSTVHLDALLPLIAEIARKTLTAKGRPWSNDNGLNSHYPAAVRMG